MKLLLFLKIGITLLSIVKTKVLSLQQSKVVLPFESESNARKVQTVEDYIEQYKESSFDQEESTTVKYNYNITLNIANDTNRDWQISPVRLTLKKWFEYYNNTDELRENANDSSRCPYIISEFSNQLSDVEGIWMACRDPALPEDCSMSVTPSSACNPYISYSSFASNQLLFQTVKINLAVSGLAIVRLTTGSSTIGTNARCFDFSLRRDPFSSCEYIKVENTSATGWTQVKSNFSAYDGFSFKSFVVQLIARFENDVAIVEKVEATDYLLCDEDRLCTTTSPGPTHSTSTTFTTPRTTSPTSTITVTTTTITTEPTTTTTTTPTTTTTTNTTTTTRAPTKTSKLDIFSDTENQIKWQVSNLSSRWLEYYEDSASLIDQAHGTNACAGIVAPIVADNLTKVEGIWSSCQDLRVSSSPNITYSSSNAETVVSLTVKFYLYGSAFIRLHVVDKCIDFSYTEVSQSPCDWRKLQQDGIYWQGIFWSANSVSEQVKGFTIDLISLSYENVVLFDKVVVNYKECSNDDCSSQNSSPTTVLTTSTDHSDTTTEEAKPPATTERETDCPTVETTSTSTSKDTKSTESSDTTDSSTESSRSTTLCTTTTSKSTIRTSTTPPDKSISNTLRLNLLVLQFLTMTIFLF